MSPHAQQPPRVVRDRRDDRFEPGHPTPAKRAVAGVVLSVQDSSDTVTATICGEDVTGIIPLGEMPPVGAICEVEARGDLLVIPVWFEGPPPNVPTCPDLHDALFNYLTPGQPYGKLATGTTAGVLVVAFPIYEISAYFAAVPLTEFDRTKTYKFTATFDNTSGPDTSFRMRAYPENTPESWAASPVVYLQQTPAIDTLTTECIVGPDEWSSVPTDWTGLSFEFHDDPVVTGICWEEVPGWVQNPDFSLASQSPRATFSDLQFSASDERNGTSGASYAALIPVVNSSIASLWASTAGDLGDAFLTEPTGGLDSFPSTTYSRQQWSVTFSSTTGWSYQVLASHAGHGVFTRAPNLSTYESGPGVAWESDKARMVGATIKVRLTYWLDKSTTGVTLADVGSDVEVYLYRFAANNNEMIAPKARRLIHTGTLPLIESSGGPGAAVIDLDVVLTEADLEGWDYGNGLMFYSVFKTPLMPRVTALSTHTSRVAARYNADVEIDPASFWTARPPRWREVLA